MSGLATDIVTALAIIVYVFVQILFIPLAIIGTVMVGWRQLLTSRKLGVSSTAIEVINGRWMMDVFGMRDDPASRVLNRALPNNSIAGLWFVLFPLYLIHRMTGKNFIFPRVPEVGEENMGDIMIARTLYFDEIIERHAVDAEQFVLLGAGFDTRAYGDLKDQGIRFIELDQKKMQALKRASLQNAGIDTDHVTYVEVDFEHDDMFERLAECGYDETKRTIFLWEGVTLYLGHGDVEKTIQDIRAHTAAGSVLIADFYALSFVKGEYIRGMKAVTPVLKLTDEELGFGIDFSSDHDEALYAYIESMQMELGSRRFLAESSKKGPYMVVAEVICP